MAQTVLKLTRDLGQRYVVRAKGYPLRGWQGVGWTNNLEEAEVMARQFLSEPSCEETSVVDRGDPSD